MGNRSKTSNGSVTNGDIDNDIDTVSVAIHTSVCRLFIEGQPVRGQEYDYSARAVVITVTL